VVIFAFIPIGTSSRAFQSPMAITEAVGQVRAWLDRSVTEVLHVDPSDIHQALIWLEEPGVGANLTTDAQIAAAAFRYGAIVHTADMDFQRSPLRSMNP
jgi:predicted nucleic acid-binding protein